MLMMDEIGGAAGEVYRHLDEKGEVTMASLKKELDIKPDLISLSLGWLAREDKLKLSKKGNSTKISLKQG